MVACSKRKNYEGGEDMNYDNINMEELEKAISEKENYDLDELLRSSSDLGCDSHISWGDH